MASTPIERKKSPTRSSMPRNKGTDNHTTISVWDDMKRVVEAVLEYTRLVLVTEEQPITLCSCFIYMNAYIHTH